MSVGYVKPVLIRIDIAKIVAVVHNDAEKRMRQRVNDGGE
jgi:hypothetical protein